MRSVTEFVAPLSRIQAAFHNKNLVLGGRKLSGASMSLSTYSEYDPADKQLTRNPHLRGYRKSAAVFSFLDRLARHIAVRTEYAAVAGPGFEQRMAVFTFIKPLAGIGWHGFRFPVSAVRAGDGGVWNDLLVHLLIPCGLVCIIEIGIFSELQHFLEGDRLEYLFGG